MAPHPSSKHPELDTVLQLDLTRVEGPHIV